MNNSNSHEASHYVVTAHPPGAVLLSTACNFLTPNSMDVVIAKSARLEIRQLRSELDSDGDTFPVVLQLPINGRLIALNPLRIPNLPTAVIFILEDRYQYAAISYSPTPPTLPKTPGQISKVSAYPVCTHSSGSLETANISRPNEGGTIVAVDPYYRCIAIHAFDGLLTILPVDLNYNPPSNAKADDDIARGNPRRPKQLLGAPFHCRIEESTILSITFLHAAPTIGTNNLPPIQIAVLYQDARGVQHLTTHVINLQKQQIHLHGSQAAPASVQWLKKSSIDGGSSMLIPVQLPPKSSILQTSTSTKTEVTEVTNQIGSAVVVIGQRQFTYCSMASTRIIPVPQALYLTYTALPKDPISGMPRYLLADELGNLHMLSFEAAQNRVVAMQLETLGSCTLSSTLTYLREGLLFVGSCFGDSQLIQIHDDPIVTAVMQGSDTNTDGPEGSDTMLDSTYLSVVEEYTNLGPILDFDLVPTTLNHGMSTSNAGSPPHLVQSQVVTASGSSKSGSIRVIRNGVGMHEYASVEISAIQAMWSLRKTYNAQEDSYLVQSFVGETRVLGVVAATSDDVMLDDTTDDADEDNVAVGGTLEEVVIPGLDSTASTLYVGNLQAGDRLLQITGTEIRVIELSGEIVCTWTNQITLATANEAGQIAIALHGGLLVYLTIEGDAITRIYENQLNREISCIDIHPFVSCEPVEMAMETDELTVPKRVAHKSSLIAVGLWDDFTVRLLSTENCLTEFVCVSLGNTDEEEGMDDQSALHPTRHNRNNMMARSLCLVTLDFSSSSGSNYRCKSESVGPGVNMLFVGKGDGTLVSFAVTKAQNTISVQSRKEVCLGTQRIDLVKLTTEQGGTCVLATGDRPTVIYIAGVVGAGNMLNPKLCYSNVNVQSNEDECIDQLGSISSHHRIAVNVACPFFSQLLLDTAALGRQQYSLCVASDSSLRLGVIDDIQKLHVTTCRLGMAPRRIVHCPDGRMFAVGCIESGIQSFGLSGDDSNMGNCVRFMDDTTFDDLERLDLEPFEMILSMTYASMAVPSSIKESPNTMSNMKTELEYKPFLFVGTAYALPDEDEPTRGRILVYSCQPTDTTDAIGSIGRAIRQITELSTEGGVYSMCQFYEGRMLVTVNSRTHVCQLVEDVGLIRLQYLGLGHFGHILSLFVKSRAQHTDKNHNNSDSRKTLPMNASTGEEISHTTNEPEEMLAIVGDLMRSISLVQYYPEHQTLEEVARDFNANWTCAVEMLNENIYLGAENWNNLFCLRRNTASTSEEIRCRLDTIGEYHLGEMCNKFMSGSLVMPVSSKNTTSNHHQPRRSASPLKTTNVESPSPNKLSGRTRRPVVSTGSQTLFGTVDGTLGVILGLDSRTTDFFSTLERAMATVIFHVGNFGHQQYRACHAKRRVHPSNGFIDGDLVESFLDLNRAAMIAVVSEMNRDGGWDFDAAALQYRDNKNDKAGDQDSSVANDETELERQVLSLEEVLAMVEEMTMLH